MQSIFKDITRFIFVEHKPCKVDIILVPGGSYPQTMNRACELFLDGYADYILPSGGFNKKLPTNLTEFDYFHGIALSKGISNDNILREDKATNTFENALFSMHLVQSRNLKIDKAMLVCKAYHARRALLTYQYVFGDSAEFSVIPVEDTRNINRNNWYTKRDSRDLVLNELIKIGAYFKKFSEFEYV